MKNCSTFAASDQDKLSLVGCGIVISTSVARHNNGLAAPNDFYTARSEIVLVDKGVVQPFLCALYYGFSNMTKTLKNCQDAIGASKATCSSTKSSKLYSQFLVEKNAKNKAYAFILSSGLLKKFTEFSCTYQNEGNNVNDRINALISNN